MTAEDQDSPPPVWSSEEDWKTVEKLAPQALDFVLDRCLLDLRDRVAALEAAKAALTVPAAVPAVADGGMTVEQLAEHLPVNAWFGPEVYARRVFAEHMLRNPIIGPRLRDETTPAPAPAPVGGVTVEELSWILSVSPSGCLSKADWLLSHPRIGPLLRGEGQAPGAAPVRVMLPDEPPEHLLQAFGYSDLVVRSTWAEARAEVERQQEGRDG